jgi:hypothetical protein
MAYAAAISFAVESYSRALPHLVEVTRLRLGR